MEDEFSFIKHITPKQYVQPSLVQGIGDDAALFNGDQAFEEIICMDTMVEGIHFSRETLSPYDIGYKALAVNISDVAAMGGYPTYCLVSVAVPKDWRTDLEKVYAGLTDLAEEQGMDLIGGDTVSAKEGFVITVTVMGRVEKGRHLLRSSAQPGDQIFVTGPLGDSAAGLALLLEHGRAHGFNTEQQKLVEIHQRPKPQVKAGRILAGLSSNIALNDISDGIASEANEIARASGAKLVLDYERLPKSEALKAFPAEKQKEWSLFGGEDFQLVGTIPGHLMELLKERFPVVFVGTVEEGEPEVVLKQDGEKIVRLDPAGYNHFNFI
ncbi:MAG TPA: thiamine-phosphate kinase [Bacillales bacterium]